MNPLESHLVHTYYLLSHPGSLEAVGFVLSQVRPIFISSLMGTPLHQTPSSTPPYTCTAPTSLQECAGACNRLCGVHWAVYGWLKLPNLTVPSMASERDSAWGDSPTHEHCQIPTVALHNHSHTDPGTLAGRKRRDREVERHGGLRCDFHECISTIQRNFGGH